MTACKDHKKQEELRIASKALCKRASTSRDKVSKDKAAAFILLLPRMINNKDLDLLPVHLRNKLLELTKGSKGVVQERVDDITKWTNVYIATTDTSSEVVLWVARLCIRVHLLTARVGVEMDRDGIEVTVETLTKRLTKETVKRLVHAYIPPGSLRDMVDVDKMKAGACDQVQAFVQGSQFSKKETAVTKATKKKKTEEEKEKEKKAAEKGVSVRDTNWAKQYDALVSWCSTHGGVWPKIVSSFQISQDFRTDDMAVRTDDQQLQHTIAQWVSRQRRIRNGTSQVAKESRQLTVDKIRKLDSIGMSWVLRKEGNTWLAQKGTNGKRKSSPSSSSSSSSSSKKSTLASIKQPKKKKRGQLKGKVGDYRRTDETKAGRRYRKRSTHGWNLVSSKKGEARAKEWLEQNPVAAAAAAR